MPILSNLTTVVLLLIAHCGSWTGANRLGPFKMCPGCRDPLGAGRPPRDHNVASSTSVLAQGEPCGVYTLTCAKGLRCVPPPREHSPLQALLQGRGICAKHSRTSPTERPHPTGKIAYTHTRALNHVCTRMCMHLQMRTNACMHTAGIYRHLQRCTEDTVTCNCTHKVCLLYILYIACDTDQQKKRPISV